MSARPEVRGTADTDGGAYSPSGQSSPYLLKTIYHHPVYEQTDGDGHQWLNDADAGCVPF